jgi:hypothetical protein
MPGNGSPKAERSHAAAGLKITLVSGWQVVPTVLNKLMTDKDPEKSKRVMKAMLQMDKIDIEPLQRAYEGS